MRNVDVETTHKEAILRLRKQDNIKMKGCQDMDLIQMAQGRV